MSVTEGQIWGKYYQDTNVSRSKLAISRIHKNIVRHDVENMMQKMRTRVLLTQSDPKKIACDLEIDTWCRLFCFWILIAVVLNLRVKKVLYEGF